MIGEILSLEEIAELRGCEDSELVALHNIARISSRCIRAGETERADEITEVVRDELAERGVLKEEPG